MLRDCVTKSPDEAELFVVCSPSLLEAFHERRCRLTQAVLATDPTIPSSDQVDVVLDNESAMYLIASLGTGIDIPGHATVDLSALRYGRILVVALPEDQPKQDGILAFLERFISPLIRAGHVYVLAENLEVSQIVDAALDPSRAKWFQVEVSSE